MSSVMIGPQRLLGSMSTARIEHKPVQMISRVAGELSKNGEPVPAATPEAPSAKAAWDPHEVWLSRVKKPREQRSA